ncbi:Tim44 domain-containing protein [Undibacterium parvum]|uniref:Tim44 domain-containing protein n=1 Tax=Undibacterium parvum TaxID=401471 RepID=A0A3S9HPG0_9BURK|nr:TIM44-like domain-containing protein [Undibacterium parvum]AZP13959.1 Tim44 domain-containing protein [Undibacterium parvum]
MKKLLFTMMLALGAMTMVIPESYAKRVGGGGSSGTQSNNVSRQAAPATANQAKPATPATAGAAATPPKPASPWKGIVGGLIGGALLGAMFSSMGLGGGLASALGSILPMLLLAGAAFFLFRMYQKRKAGGAPSAFTPQPAYAGAGAALPEIGSRIEPMSYQSGANAGSAATGSAASGFGSGFTPADQGNWTIPADFDVPAFLRNAKMYFIRLQAAFDKADIKDIHEFTTAEMYAEIKMQIQERGSLVNVTDVVSVDAQLLGLETVNNNYLASVKFTGVIKEDPNLPAEGFSEVWNLSKPVNGQGGWALAGIQQV